MKAMKHDFAWKLKASALLSGCLALLTYLLYRFFPSGILESLTISFGTVFYHFAMRLLVGAIVPRLVHEGAENGKWFCQKRFEEKLYGTLRVKQWKTYMPTYSPESFDLKKHSLEEIIHTCCCSEAVHEWIMLLSFLPVLAIPVFGAAWVFWLTSMLAALFDGCFAILQRYNRPRLIRILDKERKRL